MVISILELFLDFTTALKLYTDKVLRYLLCFLDCLIGQTNIIDVSALAVLIGIYYRI